VVKESSFPSVDPKSRGFVAGISTQFSERPRQDQVFPADQDDYSVSYLMTSSLAQDASNGPFKVFVKLKTRTHANAIVGGFRFLRKRARDFRMGSGVSHHGPQGAASMPISSSQYAGSGSPITQQAAASRHSTRHSVRGGLESGSLGSGAQDSHAGRLGDGPSSANEVVIYVANKPRVVPKESSSISDLELLESLDVSYLPSLNKQYSDDSTLQTVPCVADAHLTSYDLQRDDGVLGMMTSDAESAMKAFQQKKPQSLPPTHLGKRTRRSSARPTSSFQGMAATSSME